MQKRYKIKFLKLAEKAALKSKDPHKQVGAALISTYSAGQHALIDTGFNKLTKPYIERGYKDPSGRTRPEVIHAEADVIKCLFNSEIPGDKELFCTISPCMECAKLIYAAGIKKVYFKEYWKDAEPLEFLRINGIKYEKL